MTEKNKKFGNVLHFVVILVVSLCLQYCSTSSKLKFKSNWNDQPPLKQTWEIELEQVLFSKNNVKISQFCDSLMKHGDSIAVVNAKFWAAASHWLEKRDTKYFKSQLHKLYKDNSSPQISILSEIILKSLSLQKTTPAKKSEPKNNELDLKKKIEAEKDANKKLQQEIYRYKNLLKELEKIP